MPYFKTSQEWLDQSALLIEARPSTTRVTTRYSVKPASKPSPPTDSATAATPKPPRAVLVLKTYDPVSGVALKYKTNKAAEVTRLVSAALGRLGRGMAGVLDVPEVTMPDAEVPVVDEVVAAPIQGKRKKKGKK